MSTIEVAAVEEAPLPEAVAFENAINAARGKVITRQVVDNLVRLRTALIAKDKFAKDPSVNSPHDHLYSGAAQLIRQAR